MFYYPKRKQLFLLARLMLDHVFAYLSPGTICFSNVLFSTSFLESSRKTLFSLAYFLNQSNTKPRYKISVPKTLNHSKQLTVLTIPDSALGLCAARLYYFHDIKKLCLQNVYDKIEMVSMSIRYCLLKIVILQKIRKNKDASHN